ncbi:hypothetical protein GCM10011611_05600 [Aliidongia dinghuensis]|uniref:DUF2939 domain-containing protein n=1 Tax=Aliidongia dinghuensis TaxID=1867774 RepID=A0A8J2YPU9_9PROT|nr:DUF2939 domain-containing protein [Aliidongia dinghuensis]GGF02980.1 hypothetical protein GCM10011611_05600 [Aliidongia dinghuensis]
MNWKAPFVVIGVLAAGYVAYPYLALTQLVDAVESGDPAQLEPKVDWPSVRQGFKDDFNGALAARVSGQPDNGFAALGLALGAKLVGGAVDALVTPEGLTGIIQAGRRDKAAAAALGSSSGLSSPAPTDNEGKPRHTHVVWAFFDGLTSFTARVRGRGEADSDPPVRLRLQLEGGRWILTRVFLPVPSNEQ